ncbi:MAG: right-handed parallel beta-helix repeat-containing protein, partial [Candidatus Thorarchaeota archaeon]
MKNKSFALIVMVILIAQPLVITTSIALNGMSISLKETDTVELSQDWGSRLSPGDYTPHVPVVINSTSDFTLQSWPGDGTEGNPFVISDLNITYDHPDYLIKVTNVDNYFIIEDCFLRQLSSSGSVLLENVTHAKIQYTTIMSESGGIEVENGNGTYLHFIHVESDGDYALDVNKATDLNLQHSLYNSSSYSAVWINASEAAVIGETIFDAAWPYIDFFISHSDYVNLYDCEFHISSIELYASHCESLSIDGVRATEGDYGIQLYNCNDTVIRNADVIADFDALTLMSCDNITVTDSTFSNNVGGQAVMVNLSNEISFHQILVNDTISNGISAHSTPQLSVTQSTFSNIGSIGVNLVNSNDSAVISNSFENVGSDAISYDMAHRGNASLNTMMNVETGVYVEDADNGTVCHNTITECLGGVILDPGTGWEIFSNVISEAMYGIGGSGGAHLDAWLNDVSMCLYGFYFDNHDVMELWENTINATESGIYLTSCDDAYIRDNQITWSEIGIYLTNVYDGEFSNNIISDCDEDGIGLQGVYNTTFSGNNISRCGIAGIDYWGGGYNYFVNNNLLDCGFLLLAGPPMGYQMYNHSFSGNTVNGKLVYYAINQTSLVLNGSMYGQIILVNCTGVSITEGLFEDATCGIQLMYVNNITMSGITYQNQYMAAYALVCHNASFLDSNFAGSNEDFGIFIWDSMNPVIDGCTFDTLGGDWFGEPSAILVAGFYNITVSNSNFTDIFAAAITLETAMGPPAVFGNITDCIFENCSAGIYAGNVDNLEIEDNSFSWGIYGIYAESCDDWDVNWNEMHYNEYGIRAITSDGWDVVNNTIRWNDIGFRWEESNPPGIIADNIIALNFEWNGYSNGNHFWDDGVDTGNYWDDYSGSGVYNIPGPGSSQDRYPMQYVVYEPIINTAPDMSYPEGSEGNEIVWIPHDNFLRDWTVTIDGEAWASDAWNFDNVTLNIDGLAYGTHTVFITVWDVDNNYVNDTVIVTVFDDTPPEISGPPDHVLYIDVDLTIDWDVEDLNPTD